ncbi:MAG: HDIG domain-containing protein [Spirochaetia bacterium]|nr:HDIG domain-containing protein [Spirochaetia bacterium]
MKRTSKLWNNIKHNRLLSAVVTITFIVNILMIVLIQKTENSSPDSSSYAIGMVADRDITADTDFQYLDKKAMSRKKYEAEQKITPIYKTDNAISSTVISKYDQFTKSMLSLINSNAEGGAFADYSLELRGEGINLNPEFLLEISKNPSAKTILEVGESTLDFVMYNGIIGKNELSSISSSSGNIELWRWSENHQERSDINISDLTSAENIAAVLQDHEKNVGLTSEDTALMVKLISTFVRENIFFDYDETAAKKEIMLSNLEPVYKSIHNGEVIVKKGFIISDSDLEKISMMRQNTRHMNIENLLGTIFFLILIYLFAGILLPFMLRRSYFRKRQYIMLFIIFVELFFLAISILVKLPPYVKSLYAVFMIPTAMFSMLLCIVCNMLTGALFSFLAAAAVFMFDMTGGTTAALFVLLSGLSGTLIVHNYKNRFDLIKAGLILSLLDVIFMLTFTLLMPYPLKTTLLLLFFSFLNSFISAVLCLGVLPIIEHINNVPTQSRLAELSDLNTPILQKMLHRASGTFNHSILVGNLAETACIEIKANGLLARVGGYYHDIGKIDQADYFVENQIDRSKHSTLTPKQSADIIRSHVTYGVEKGKELNLPQEVIDIIAHHHGNGVIAYFYYEAMKQAGECGIVNAADFSYDQGRPRGKEEAVVLLADNVEAAVRAMQSPTLKDIENRVFEIIKSKIDANLLSESDLTFNELQIIGTSFINTLRGIHHSRIQYPKQEEINELSAN